MTWNFCEMNTDGNPQAESTKDHRKVVSDTCARHTAGPGQRWLLPLQLVLGTPSRQLCQASVPAGHALPSHTLPGLSKPRSLAMRISF